MAAMTMKYVFTNSETSTPSSARPPPRACFARRHTKNPSAAPSATKAKATASTLQPSSSTPHSGARLTAATSTRPGRPRSSAEPPACAGAAASAGRASPGAF